MKYVHSPGGVLLNNLGSEWFTRHATDSDATGPKVPTMTVDEFASTPADELERNIEERNWKFATSSEPVILQKEKLE